MMDILDKIDKLLPEAQIKAGYGAGWARKGGAGSTEVYWELCDPKNEDDGCTEVSINIPWYYAPEEKDVGFRGGLEIDGDESFSAPVKFMGKKYRAGQSFPNSLRKLVYDYERSRQKNWESFLEYEVERADSRF